MHNKILMLFIACFLACSSNDATAAEKRGPRGHRGHSGKHGNNGQVVVSGVYAEALYKQGINQGPTTFAVANGPIKFNVITQAEGINIKKVPKTGTFIIESSGDYFVSYNVYASFNSGGTGVINPAYIDVLVNGVPVASTIVGTNTKDPTIQISGDLILHLKKNDKVQLAPRNHDLLTLHSLSSQPLKLASLTLQKL